MQFFVYAEGERLNPAMMSSLSSLALQLQKDESVRDQINSITKTLPVHLVQANEGDILLDSINDVNMQDLSVFGICDKQLACHSCRVNFKHGG